MSQVSLSIKEIDHQPPIKDGIVAMKNTAVIPANLKKQSDDETVEPAKVDIMQVLHKDHMKVDELFFQFTQTEDDSKKKDIMDQISLELGLHAKAEEQIVYPVVRDGKEEVEDMMDEADTEHHVVKFLIAELDGMKPSDSHYDSKVTVLSELVKHHVKEEENDIFEKLKSSDADLEELAQKFTERKLQLAEKPLPKETFPVAGSR